MATCRENCEKCYSVRQNTCCQHLFIKFNCLDTMSMLSKGCNHGIPRYRIYPRHGKEEKICSLNNTTSSIHCYQ
uniref:Pentatricopeptide repeat-containing protein At1g25360 n=1 Tax=Rhizophora mucronata TaxID=61149 RepID=A0A2P2LWZ8_RHIMU